jgi:membrane protein involved in colicin uptake
MCRGCLFVKVDVSSGGDIDGCIKNDVIDEFKNVKYIDLLRAKEKALMVLNYEESLIDEENCVEELKQPESANEEEIKEQWSQWLKARDKACRSYKQYLSDRILRAEKLPMSALRRMFEVKAAPVLSSKNCVKLTAFMEAS